MTLKPAAALNKDRTQPTAASFQHRHYAEIARIIRTIDKVHNQEQGVINTRADVAEHFANELGAQNGNFNRERFLRACLD